MFLPTKRPTRRQFLERSALGAGSLLVGPLLFDSCTDHNIPGPDGPNGPIILPPVSDNQIDWNDDVKTVVTTGLSLIPEVGGILGPLAGILWPQSGDSPWDQVKAQVEQLVDQKIADDDYKRVSTNLEGLNNVITIYVNAINNRGDIKTNWANLRGDFALYQPNFQQQGDEVLLLPLFVQFANMYLATLRDAVVFGTSWGMADGDVSQAQTDLTNLISSFGQYATKTYKTGLTNVLNNTKSDDANNEPFMTANAYSRQMTLWVLDYVDTWPYYNPDPKTGYPNGAVASDGTPINLFTREIYSDPYGNTYKGPGFSNPITLPAAATQRPTQVTVWGGSRIDAAQLTYPAGGGPGGLTQTPRMGDQNGGTNQAPKGGVFTVSLGNPIIQAQASYDFTQTGSYHDMAVDTLQFAFNDGTANTTYSPQMGGKQGSQNSGWVGYNNMALSSIYIQGVNFELNNSANCIVFGFLYWSPPAVTLRALANIYITSPKERSVADFTNAYPKLGLSASSITNDLKKARTAYWAYVKSKVK